MIRERFFNVTIGGQHGVLDLDTMSFAPARGVFDAVQIALKLERGETPHLRWGEVAVTTATLSTSDEGIRG